MRTGPGAPTGAGPGPGAPVSERSRPEERVVPSGSLPLGQDWWLRRPMRSLAVPGSAGERETAGGEPMQAQATELRRPIRAPSGGHRGKLAAGALVLVSAASVTVPLAVVFLGVLLVALVALDSSVPGLVPGLRPLLRVPVAPVFQRRMRLVLAGGFGVLLVVCGTAGAKLSSQVRTEWRLDQSQRLAAETQVIGLLEQAREHLSAGEVELAELTLMDARGVSAIEPQRQREIDELLERVRRSGDSAAILKILLALPAEEFEAFARGESVPPALELGERTLTYRAVELARSQIEAARAQRAGH
jgi:hypothetical protein